MQIKHPKITSHACNPGSVVFILLILPPSVSQSLQRQESVRNIPSSVNAMERYEGPRGRMANPHNFVLSWEDIPFQNQFQSALMKGVGRIYELNARSHVFLVAWTHPSYLLLIIAFAFLTEVSAF